MRLAVFSLIAALPATASAQVVITEVQPNPDGSDTAEWIELHNLGANAVTIADWTLVDFVGTTDPARESTTRWAFPPGALIAGGEVIVVARQSTPDGFFELFARRPTYELTGPNDDPLTPNLIGVGGSTQLALGNSAEGDAVILRDAQNTIVSAVEWGALDRTVAGAPANIADSGESLTRIANTGSSATDFIVASTPTPFVGFGTSSAPIIGSARVSPAHVGFMDMVTITATVAGATPIAAVRIAITIATSSSGPAMQSYSMQAMTPSTGRSYEWSAPASYLAPGLNFADPATFHARYVRVYVEAEDTNGTTATEPAGADSSAANSKYLQRNVMPTAATSIALAREQDTSGRARWRDHSVRVRGIATVGPNVFDRSQTQFALQDGTAAVQVFSFSTNYPPFDETDEIEVTGTIEQFYGMTQLSPSLLIHPLGNQVSPNVQTLTISFISVSAEALEGQLVEIDGVQLVQTTTAWRADDPGFGGNYEITDGTGAMTLRIWGGTDLPGRAPPAAPFRVRGIIGQRAVDGRNGTTGGYQIWPRRSADLIAGQPAIDGGVIGVDVTAPPIDAGFTDGASPDGAAPHDGATSPDAAAGADVSPSRDAGSFDATIVRDDAGDAAAHADANPRSDATAMGADATPRPRVDGSTGGSGGARPRSSGGCGCATQRASSGAASTGVVVIVALLGLRRRRSTRN